MKAGQAEYSRKLGPEQQAFYRERGYFFPVRVLGGDEANDFRQRFETYLDQYSARLNQLLPRDRRVYLSETHLFLKWVYQIVALPSILDAVEAVLGPNILVWGTQWFPKAPGDRAYVSWHQDGTYWGLHPPNVTTAWIALSESTVENGCMRVVPGTQRTPKLPQRETYAADNMLSRGQEIAVDVDEGHAIDLILEPGEMSLHHIGIVHGSGPNHSNRARIGLAVRYVGPEVKQEGSVRDNAMLVRGKDDYGHFELVGAPQEDSTPEQSSVHAEALGRKAANILSKGAPPAK